MMNGKQVVCTIFCIDFFFLFYLSCKIAIIYNKMEQLGGWGQGTYDYVFNETGLLFRLRMIYELLYTGADKSQNQTIPKNRFTRITTGSKRSLTELAVRLIWAVNNNQCITSMHIEWQIFYFSLFKSKIRCNLRWKKQRKYVEYERKNKSQWNNHAIIVYANNRLHFI